MIYYGTDHRLFNNAVPVAEYAREWYGLLRWVMLKWLGTYRLWPTSAHYHNVDLIDRGILWWIAVRIVHVLTDSMRAPPKYKSKALMPEPSCWCYHWFIRPFVYCVGYTNWFEEWTDPNGRLKSLTTVMRKFTRPTLPFSMHKSR